MVILDIENGESMKAKMALTVLVSCAEAPLLASVFVQERVYQ